MIGSLRNFAKTKIAGVFVFIIIIPFVFWGMGSMFSGGNTNNIAEVNNNKISTQDFMNYINESRIQKSAIKENLEKNIIEELLSTLISSTLLDLEIKDFNIKFTELILLKKIKANKNFQDENNSFQRTKYEKFLLTNNMTAAMFEQRIKGNELQKKLFDYIGGGTVVPIFLTEKNYENENRTLEVDYINLNTFYKKKENFTDLEKKDFINENLEALKREYIDFEFAELRPKNLIGIDEFNQDFFDLIDKIENKISNGDNFKSILKDLDLNPQSVNNYIPSSNENDFKNKIYALRSSDMEIIESGDNFLLFNISKRIKKSPDLNDEEINEQITEMIYQKNKFDVNKKIIKEIDEKKFDDSKFKEIGKNFTENLILKSINDDAMFDNNSVKILYSLPLDSFTLISDEEKNIYLIKIKNSSQNNFNQNDENYLKFVNKMNTDKRTTILKSYDLLLNNKYKVQLNQKTIDRVKNYFK
jgi:peptidyl-prolyl cis-trans isomerase D